MKDCKFENEIKISFFSEDEKTAKNVFKSIQGSLLKEVRCSIKSVKGTLTSKPNNSYKMD